MSSPSSNNGDDDASLMKMEMKREELGGTNEGDKTKKVAGDQVPAAEEEDILKPYLTHLTPAEIEAFRVIEIVHIQNKYLTRENILHQEHIIHLRSVIRRLENLLILKYRIASSPPSSTSPPKENRVSGMGTPLGFRQAWGRRPGIVSSHYLFAFTYFSSIFLL